MNLRCSARGSGCEPGAVPSQGCWALPSGRRVLCASSPAALNSELAAFLASRRDSTARPWEEDREIEVGHPAVLFLQPMNCVPYFRAARRGNAFTALAAEPCGTLARALSSLVSYLALAKSFTLLLPCARYGVCTGTIARVGEEADLSTCSSRPERAETCWMAWCETAEYSSGRSGAFTAAQLTELEALAATMEQARLLFAPDFVVLKDGAAYVRPLSIALAPQAEPSNARAAINASLEHTGLPRLKERRAPRESALRLAAFLEALGPIASADDRRALELISSHGELRPWEGRPAPRFFWLSSYLCSLQPEERAILAEGHATSFGLDDRVISLDPVVRSA